MPEDDVFQQLVELDDMTVIAPINSPYFIRELTVGDRMLIAITGEKILRFAIASSKWCVFQINQEYARGIWGHTQTLIRKSTGVSVIIGTSSIVSWIQRS